MHITANLEHWLSKNCTKSIGVVQSLNRFGLSRLIIICKIISSYSPHEDEDDTGILLTQ